MKNKQKVMLWGMQIGLMVFAYYFGVALRTPERNENQYTVYMRGYSAGREQGNVEGNAKCVADWAKQQASHN